MTNIQRTLAALIFCLMGLAGKSLHANDGNAGDPNTDSVAATAVDVIGVVQVQAGSAWQAVQTGQLFGAGDRLTTGDNSRLQLVLADGSSVALEQDSELTLDQAGAGEEGSVTLLTLARGLLDAMVQKLRLGSRFEIQTPYAIAAVKGTDFEVSDANKASAVTVSEGVVQMGDSSRRNFTAIHPQQRGEFRGNLFLGARDLNAAERQMLKRRWSGARALHVRRFELLRRFAHSPLHGRFLQQMHRRSFNLRKGGRSMNRGRRFSGRFHRGLRDRER